MYRYWYICIYAVSVCVFTNNINNSMIRMKSCASEYIIVIILCVYVHIYALWRYSHLVYLSTHTIYKINAYCIVILDDCTMYRSVILEMLH